MKSLQTVLVDMIDRRPGLGYLGAALPTTAGFWGIVETATKLGGLLSVVLGILVAVATLRVQLRHKRRLDAEEAERNARKAA